jgi:hypothetical protein
MDKFSLIVVSDETSPVRRYEIRKVLVRNSIIGAALATVLLLGLLVDYVRVRVDNVELDGLREETIARREQVAGFQVKLEGVEERLATLLEFERKVRIIANLPGSAGTGGGEITAVLGGDGDLGAPGAEGGLDEPLDDIPASGRLIQIQLPKEDASVPERVRLLEQAAEYLGEVAEGRSHSLEALVDALEGKRDFLASSPSIWPATDIVAPARGRVVFAGKRGPLGNAVTIDHGWGVRTQYGHNKELFVKKGDRVERGDRIATLGNSGRSTGPHLHYVVEVNGKTRNPLDYIFD